MTDTPSAEAVRVVIAEDYEIGRIGLRHSLETFSTLPGTTLPLAVVGEAVNGTEAVMLAETLQPHLILMDIEMPEMNGILATQAIKAHWPDIKIIMLTSHRDEREVRAALSAGADGYCLKDIRAGKLLQVIHLVLDGGLWLDPVIAHLLMDSLLIQPPGSLAAGWAPESVPLPPFLETTPGKKHAVPKANPLTRREMEVLALIVEGKSNQAIADTLSVSIHTAKTHIANLIDKLAVDDRTQAAVKALREGLVSTHEN